MTDAYFSWILRNRVLVLFLLAAVMVAGAIQFTRLPTDAFPDISPVMVPIFVEAHGMAPEEVERLITQPIESAMNGLPGVKELKSTSAFGMSVIYVYFEDGLDIYFCRQIVSGRLSGALSDLPDLHEPPSLGPISTGLGEIYMYYLTLDEGADTEGKDKQTYLREVNDWIVKRQIQMVPGITDILSMGGYVLQYAIEVNPRDLHRYKLDLDDIVDAVVSNNDNVGGQFLVLGVEEYLVRGIGLAETREDLRNIQVKVVEGTPIRIGDVAEVKFGREERRGVVVLNGEEEIVAGIVLKLYGENTSEVIDRLSRKMPEVIEALPPGVHLVPYYNQSRLVHHAVTTVRNAMALGGLLVLLSLFFFLGRLRTALIVAISIPFCAFFAFLLMGWAGLSANLMSLGGIAIAIGMLGDGSIVMVENISRLYSRKEREKRLTRSECLLQAAREVSRPILFSIVTIILVFLPLFTLEGVEGKMFSPMALTITFALLGSILAALALTPVLASFLLCPDRERSGRLIQILSSLYRDLLEKTLTRKIPVIGISLLALVASLILLGNLGTEFIPVLEEGVIQINVTMSPSISLEEATRVISAMQKDIKSLPEIESTVSKIGRPETGSHPHPVNFGMIQAVLKPEHEWRHHLQKRDLVREIGERLSSFPGVQLNFTQPIQNLFDELLSGVRTQLAIKIYGEDLGELKSIAGEVREAIETVPGLVDLAVEQNAGQPQVQVVADREACARYGVRVSQILELVEMAVGGEVVDELYLNTRRYGIFVRYKKSHRDTPEAIRNLLLSTSTGVMVPLSQVAEVREVTGPIQINRERNHRRWTVTANVRGRDMGSVVKELQARIQQRVTLPPGAVLEIGGQFENQRRAMRRLSLIVPLTLFLIVLMLYLSLGTVREALLIFINVPLALIGGVLGLVLAGEYLSVPSSVGFIALFGIAVQNGLILVSTIRQSYREGMDLHQAVVEGSVLRLRPVLMTALTTMLGLIPLLVATGVGSEVQRPLAAVVVFGLVSSTFLTLFLLPALYPWFAHGRETPASPCMEEPGP
ncbi:MAG TPA: CusA/CzcA family heavy metal efflux RND transporter [Thermoanaerobaculia bacterium]|nr:CusA/CzcA family heavy metal efflux RND transporter [Thermoanaerobaculia bacterium]HUM29182.1 CusA/CzcA family heavy metal efflux RND transporter [Thermoanaerobaculia bacterium]HXK67560.1 CusA/CzcA family heavy metal efflux RND transporter [Thermoanaerobaculia bacterium]